MALSICPVDHDEPPRSPELDLCTSILLQAFRDLRFADEQIANDAQRWFASGQCAWLCEVLELPLERVQAAAQRQLCEP